MNSLNYTNTIIELAQSPQHRGAYFIEDAHSKGLALLEAKHNDIKCYWLIDIEKESVYSCRFFAYGGTLSLALGEVLCQLAEEKTVQEALKITPKMVDSVLRDDPLVEALDPQHLEPIKNLVLILAQAYPQAKKVTQLQKEIKQSNFKKSLDIASLSEQEKKWTNTSLEEKKQAIESVLDEHIRAGLQMDGGDITILDIEDHYRVLIRWEGACGGCSSSSGATLSFVENKLRDTLFSKIEIIQPENTL